MVVYCLCMRANHPNKLSNSLVSAVFAFVVIAGSLGQAFADSKPYFVTKGSDIFTGGYFTSGANCTTNYQEPTYPANSSNSYKGAILGYANVGASRTGAHSDLGAFSLGLVEGGTAGIDDYGFFSGLSGTKSLSFSNNDRYNIGATKYWGGIFEGVSLKSNCIPDYYSNPKNGAKTPLGSGYTINQSALDAASGNYSITGNATLTGGTVPANWAGKGIAYFVDGDVTISGDVSYDLHTASISPKFALVVQGNIYIKPGVKNLAGWYIAQPKPASSTTGGVIWTCVDPGSLDGDPGGPPKDTWMRINCTSPLTVNGALTAKQVNLGRIDASGNPLPPLPGSETVNYIPEMAIGGGFFNQPPSTTAPIQSLISLPPVF